MAMTGKDQLGIEVMRQKVLSLGGVVACVHDSDRGLGASASDCQAGRFQIWAKSQNGCVFLTLSQHQCCVA